MRIRDTRLVGVQPDATQEEPIGRAAAFDLFREARQRPIACRQVIQNPDLPAHQQLVKPVRMSRVLPHRVHLSLHAA
jgi:hypothetical protein